MCHSQRLALAASILPLAPMADAGSVAIHPVADTSLFEWTRDFNFGRQIDLPAGGLGGQAGSERLARALYRFDVAAAVPAGALITSAEMSLHVVMAPEQFPRKSDFALYRVLIAWGEGLGDGEQPGGRPAMRGEATWNNRFHPDEEWSAPGGQFGTDFAAEPSALKTDVDAVGEYIFPFRVRGIDDLQSMRDDPTGNHGWVLRSLGEDLRKTARRWSSREGAGAPIPLPRPELRINWLVPPEITAVKTDPLTREFLVRIAGLAGQTYQLQTSGDLENWSSGSSQTATVNGELTFTVNLSNPARYARISTSHSP